MDLDRIFERLRACDNDTSVRLDGGAHFIAQLSEQGPLAFLHYLFAPVTDLRLAEAERMLGTLPEDYRTLLQRTNGALWFDKAIFLFGCAGPSRQRGLRLEDQSAFSLELENKIFAGMESAAWLDGWMRIGGVTGWSSQLSMVMNRDGRAAIAEAAGKRMEFESLEQMLARVIEGVAPCFSCAGRLDPSYADLEAALSSLIRTH